MKTRKELEQMQYGVYTIGTYAYFDGKNYYNEKGQLLPNIK